MKKGVSPPVEVDHSELEKVCVAANAEKEARAKMLEEVEKILPDEPEYAEQLKTEKRVVKMTKDKKLQLVEMYDAGFTVNTIAKHFDISAIYVYAILNQPEIKEFRYLRTKTTMDALKKTIKINAKKVDQMMSTYLDEALKPDRIEETKLTGLFSSLDSMLGRIAQVEEIELKKKELEVRKLEAQNQNDVNKGLLAEFGEVIKKASKPATEKTEE